MTIAETVIEKMREAYPDLERNREFILKVIEQEEARFHDTLDAGLIEVGEAYNQHRTLRHQPSQGRSDPPETD